MSYQFQYNDKVWAVSNTEYKLMKTTIYKRLGELFKVRGYPYWLSGASIFYTKNHAIDELICRLKVLKDRHYTPEEIGKKPRVATVNDLDDEYVLVEDGQDVA